MPDVRRDEVVGRVHGVGGDDDEVRAPRLEPLGGIDHRRAQRRPVALVGQTLLLGELAERDRVQRIGAEYVGPNRSLIISLM